MPDSTPNVIPLHSDPNAPRDRVPEIEMFMDDDRIIFRDQEALDLYVQEAIADIESRVANVRRYATLTRDSISVERRAMADDVLHLLERPTAPRQAEPTDQPEEA